jgi:hypothetical protein
VFVVAGPAGAGANDWAWKDRDFHGHISICNDWP